MHSLRLDVEHKQPEPREEASPTGSVRVESGDDRAELLIPEKLEAGRLYPLITVLHGAGRQDEMLTKLFRREPNARQALFLIPRSHHPTWDLIVGAGRPDLDFLEFAYDLIYRRYPIDPAAQSIVGYSDDLLILSAAVSTVALHITPEVRAQARHRLDRWFAVRVRSRS